MRCYVIEVCFCNEYNSLVDKYYNEHPDLEVNENNYSLPQR